MSTRIYLVTDRDTQAKRLIRAASQAQAIRHAVQARFEATVASQDDLLGLLTAGQAVESAAPQTPEAEPQAAG
jgi:hypothetical protein